MSHAFHQGPDDAVLYDACAECDQRAAHPLTGLLTLDRENFARLRERMVAVEYRNQGGYRTHNEAKLGQALYHISVLLARHGEVVV